MNYQNRGKLYLFLGIILVIVAAWYDSIYAAFPAGLLIAWSY